MTGDRRLRDNTSLLVNPLSICLLTDSVIQDYISSFLPSCPGTEVTVYLDCQRIFNRIVNQAQQHHFRLLIVIIVFCFEIQNPFIVFYGKPPQLHSFLANFYVVQDLFLGPSKEVEIVGKTIINNLLSYLLVTYKLINTLYFADQFGVVGFWDLSQIPLLCAVGSLSVDGKAF